MQRSLLHVARITTSDLLQCPAAQGLRVMGPRCSQNRVPRYLKGRLEPSIRTTVPKTVKDTEGHAGDEEIAHVNIGVGMVGNQCRMII